ncbi:MAG: hypothetical protein KC438_02365 [Thermomicrobiales bacterium]|nr:hypothetical protein [Thermomicrobiales bacterium]MCO5223460.1 hypothetical protein [Thermomicrobiales bacterium]
MRFGQVTGILHRQEGGYRIEVILDTRTSVTTVRDEVIPNLLLRNGELDAPWTVDQLTQETIGTDLALQGWEAIARGEAGPDPNLDAPMVVYLVRG